MISYSEKLNIYIKSKFVVCLAAIIFVSVASYSGDIRAIGLAVSLILIGATTITGLSLISSVKKNTISITKISLSLASDIVPLVMGLYFIGGGLTNTWLFFIMIIIFISGYLFTAKTSFTCAGFAYGTILTLYSLEYLGLIPNFGTYSINDTHFMNGLKQAKDYLIPLFLLYFIAAFSSGKLNTRIKNESFKLVNTNLLLEKEVVERKTKEIELKKYTTELKISNKYLEEFAYVASHDLQEPLRKIIAFSDRFNKKYASSLDEHGLDYLKRMNASASRMQEMINQLLAFSRISTQAKPFTQTDLNKIFSDIILDLEFRLEQTHGRIFIKSMPILDADPIQMRQLFLNLLSNALKFKKKDQPPEIKIDYTIFDDNCEITIEDNGIGFDEKHTDKIFNLFERLHGKTEYDGTGMGLAICKKIVEHHRGFITATSKPDVGSVFKVTLPLIQSEIIKKPEPSLI